MNIVEKYLLEETDNLIALMQKLNFAEWANNIYVKGYEDLEFLVDIKVLGLVYKKLLSILNI